MNMKLLKLSNKINHYCNTDNNVVKDLNKAFQIVEIITGIGLCIVGSIILLVGGII